MLQRLTTFARHLAKEPPFRLIARSVIRTLATDVHTRALWDVEDRPQYMLGVLRAAQQAKESGVKAISVAEFGVAGGAGLLRLQDYARRVQAATGVTIHVVGFDTGAGLPAGTRDFRDHPEIWSPGDYPMNWDALRPQLGAQTRLVLGDVRETIPAYIAEGKAPPLGFVSIDVDLYSSTRDALRILSHPDRSTLLRVVIYLDDAETMLYHRFAGELLAVEEFNQLNQWVKIDRWRGIRSQRPFPEHAWLDRMYVAYDLEAANRLVDRPRATQVLSLDNATNLD